MVVDWDQKDMKKAEAFNQQFADALQKLYDRGLTQEQLLSQVEARTNDKTKFAALKAQATLLGKSATDAGSIANLLQRQLSGMGERGASWNGQVVQYAMAIVPLVILGALIIYQAVWKSTHRCAEASREEVCSSVCDDYSYSDYNCDSWGENCTSGEYCARSHEECGLEEQCQRWEKIP
ncbi:MAG: hypothetical protein ACJ76H_11640 [Bacteriovoracaceae bacterium]